MPLQFVRRNVGADGDTAHPLTKHFTINVTSKLLFKVKKLLKSLRLHDLFDVSTENQVKKKCRGVTAS